MRMVHTLFRDALQLRPGLGPDLGAQIRPRAIERNEDRVHAQVLLDLLLHHGLVLQQPRLGRMGKKAHIGGLVQSVRVIPPGQTTGTPPTESGLRVTSSTKQMSKAS